MEIAVFGGSFDPPTLAHEAVIGACLDKPEFDEVWLMPSGVRCDKPGMRPAGHRQAMLEAVYHDDFQDEPRLVLSDFEMNLPQPNRTADTVNALRQTLPEHNFWFVFGADTYGQMSGWADGDKLKGELPLILVERQGYELPPEGERIKHIIGPQFTYKAISSTLVRRRLENGEAINDLVSAGVERYIACNGLYKAIQLSGHGAY